MQGIESNKEGRPHYSSYSPLSKDRQELAEFFSSRKNAPSKIPIAIALLLLVAFSALMLKPSLVGFLISEQQETYTDYIGANFTESSVYNLDINGTLTSVLLKGYAIGGSAKVYLENNETRLLIAQSLEETIVPATGFVVSEISNASLNISVNKTDGVNFTDTTNTTNDVLIQLRQIDGQCIETCDMAMQGPFRLIIELNDSVVNIESLTYTKAQENVTEPMVPMLITDKEDYIVGETVNIEVVPDIYYTLSVIDGVNYTLLTEPRFVPLKSGTYMIHAIGVYNNSTIALNKNITVVETQALQEDQDIVNVTTTQQTSTTIVQTSIIGQTTTTTLQNITINGSNRPPVLVKPITDIILGKYMDSEVVLESHFIDPDGDALTFELVFVDIEPIKIKDGKLVIQPNTKTVKIVASDGRSIVESNVFAIKIVDRLEDIKLPEEQIKANITYNLTQIVFNLTTDKGVYYVGEEVKISIAPIDSSAQIKVSKGNLSFMLENSSFNASEVGVYRIDALISYNNQTKNISKEILVIEPEQIAPVLVRPIPDITVYMNGSIDIDLKDHFFDADSNLTYTIETGLFAQQMQGNVLRLTAINVGNETITIRATDGANEMVAQFRAIVVEDKAPTTDITTFIAPSIDITRFADGNSVLEFRLGDAAGTEVVRSEDKTSIVFNFPSQN